MTIFYAMTPQPALEKGPSPRPYCPDTEMAGHRLGHAVRRAAQDPPARRIPSATSSTPWTKKPGDGQNILQDARRLHSKRPLRRGRSRPSNRSEVGGVIHGRGRPAAPTLFVEPTARRGGETRKILQLRSQEKAGDRAPAGGLLRPVRRDGADVQLRLRGPMLKLDVLLAKAKTGRWTKKAMRPAGARRGCGFFAGARAPSADRAGPRWCRWDIALGGEYDTLVITGPKHRRQKRSR